MDLDIAARPRLLALLDHYGSLLTEHQRETLHLHLSQDWSYAEIANSQGVTRTAIYDLVHRSVALLEDYERKLGLHRQAEERRGSRDLLKLQVEGLHAEVKRLRKVVKEMA